MNWSREVDKKVLISGSENQINTSVIFYKLMDEQNKIYNKIILAFLKKYP